MLMGCACMFLCTYKTGMTTIKNKGWYFGWREFLGEELLYLFCVNGITPGGSAWHNAEITEKKIGARDLFLEKEVNMKFITS